MTYLFKVLFNFINLIENYVIDYLKIFTLLSLEEIGVLETGLKNDPGARVAQKRLAEEITSTIHGKETATTVANVSDVIFGNRALHEMTSGEREILTRNAPTSKVTIGTNIVDVLVETGLASSKREARTFVESGAVSVNAIKCIELTDVLEERHFSDRLAILKRGKKQVHILEI